MPAVMLTLAYEGTGFSGFQLQLNGRTVQEELERALLRLTSNPVRITGAGRTDAGVHARGQVVGFRTESRHAPETYLRALNAMLPDDVAVVSAEMVPETFHARYWALSKTYTYDIWRERARPVLERRFVYHYPHALDAAAMREAAALLVGKHDFAAFQAAGSSAKTSTREILCFDVAEEGPIIRLKVQADGFLYHMVRILTGTLVQAGRGVVTPREVQEICCSRRRENAGPTAPPGGLCLQEVHYRRTGGIIAAPEDRVGSHGQTGDTQKGESKPVGFV